MGSDNPPNNLFNAVLQAANKLGVSYTLVVIATKPVIDELSPLLAELKKTKGSAAIVPKIVSDTIFMSDDPLEAVRRKKGSSVMVGMRMLKKHQIDAFVSCGNTGALVAGAAISLPRLEGVSRPALLAMLPTQKGSVAVLDVGGNISYKAHHLVQFACLGAAYQRAIHGIEIPTVGLLNVGSEAKKGTKEVRQAYSLLKARSQELSDSEEPPYMNFIGNIEGADVFKGAVDVLITDGFTGNVLIKTAEGVASLIFHTLMEICQRDTVVKFEQVAAELQKQFNYAEYPGAIVCGIDGIVIKVHGSASPKAFLSSILGAADCIQKQVIARIKQQLQSGKSHDKLL